MKITKNQLKQIIKEELSRVLDENVPNPEFRSKVASGEEESFAFDEGPDYLNFGQNPRDESIIQTHIDEATKAFEEAAGISAGENLDAFIGWAKGQEAATWYKFVKGWEKELKRSRDYVRSNPRRRR